MFRRKDKLVVVSWTGGFANTYCIALPVEVAPQELETAVLDGPGSVRRRPSGSRIGDTAARADSRLQVVARLRPRRGRGTHFDRGRADVHAPPGDRSGFRFASRPSRGRGGSVRGRVGVRDSCPLEKPLIPTCRRGTSAGQGACQRLQDALISPPAPLRGGNYPAGVLSASDVIAATGDHPVHAVVLVTAAVGDFAIALVDTNGDARCIDFHTLWRNRDGVWALGGSTGPEPSEQGVLQRADTADFEWAYGRIEPLASITVKLAGDSTTTTATVDGWWAVLARKP